MTAVGGIELERTVESIRVGRRHRCDLGDLDALAASIDRDGLLQPPTITPDGVLVCGARRLAAIKLLGWRTVNVWVRSGISDRLGHLLAEQDDNQYHKPLTPLETAALYRELRQVMDEEAARRKAATQFSSTNQPGRDGPGKFPGPSLAVGDAREQAAAMLTGGASYKTLEKIGYLERLATDPASPEGLRRQVRDGLDRIEAGAHVDPIFRSVRDATSRDEQDAELGRIAAETIARATAAKKAHHENSGSSGVSQADDSGMMPERYSIRAFLATWGELESWWIHYVPDTLARDLTDAQIQQFLDTVEGTTQFADRLQAAHRGTGQDTNSQEPAGRPQLRAL